jgi:hypothetical protein
MKTRERMNSNSFKSLFSIELKRRLNARDIIILSVIGLILLLAAQCGRDSYNDTQEKKQLFREAEATKVKEYTLYRQYGGFGVRLMFVPSAFAILNNTPGLSGLLAHFDTTEKLTLYTPQKGRQFFVEKSGYMSFLGVVLLFGVFLALIYGHNTTAKKSYLRFLSSISTSPGAFWRVFLSRLLLLNTGFLLLLTVPLLWLLKDGIGLFGPPLPPIALGMVLTVTFFYSAGCVIGSIKGRSTRAITLAAVYFLSVLFIPWMADRGAHAHAGGIEPLFNFQLTNLKIIMSVEKKLIEQFGILDKDETPSPELVKKIKAAVRSEHGKIREREQQMRGLMRSKLEQRQTISCFFPVLFYFSVNRETTSQGGRSFLDFYSYSEQKKAEFIDFYVQKRFIERSPEGKVESFIKDDENMFIGKNRLPLHFPLGVAVTLVYILVLSWIAYVRFKGFKTGDFPSMNIDIKPGKLNFLLTGDPGLKNHAYRFFTGSSDHPPITVNGEPARASGFVYLPNPATLPRLMEKILGKIPLWQSLWQFARDSGKLIVFDDFFIPLKPAEIESIRDDIIKGQVNSLYISKDEYLAYSIAQHLIFSDTDDTVEPVRLLKRQSLK